jgi:hypothetical protein
MTSFMRRSRCLLLRQHRNCKNDLFITQSVNERTVNPFANTTLGRKDYETKSVLRKGVHLWMALRLAVG